MTLDYTDITFADPKTWSVSEVMLWLRWCSRTYEINDIDPLMFGFNGKALVLLTYQMFQHRLPNNNKGALILYTVT